MNEKTLFDKYGLIVDSGKIIFKENEEGDTMYIIQEGNVRISKMMAGKEHILAVLGKGDFFGEMAIVNRVRRTATATAVGTVRLLTFDREGFIGMIEKNARIALNIIDKLCRRVQQANNQIQHLVRGNAKGLISLNLFYAFAENGMETARLDYHKTAREICLNLELPQNSGIQYFEELERKGIIRIQGNDLSLLDKEKLSALAQTVSSQQ